MEKDLEFTVLPHEWWHFNHKETPEWPVMDIQFGEIKSSVSQSQSQSPDTNSPDTEYTQYSYGAHEDQFVRVHLPKTVIGDAEAGGGGGGGKGVPLVFIVHGGFWKQKYVNM